MSGVSAEKFACTTSKNSAFGRICPVRWSRCSNGMLKRAGRMSLFEFGNRPHVQVDAACLLLLMSFLHRQLLDHKDTNHLNFVCFRPPLRSP